ncbi:glycine zipper family protein [Burkholderia cenocepacia]|uniref:Glycine zipper family protein n=1 Tax=Burkholderia cenocepacia TaxID=95486 RepID=A0AAW4TFZ2_9BURK|nr:glycine zipper family protein [Burkholderia cenocepacia]MCA8381213.1 glycine zipper family protein [Burkholderia cenocepacia]MDS0849897.1 glycine zipper family protein [Burkholderia cenocepacia]
MSDFVYRTTTNTTADSKYDVLGHHMPARIFFFVTVEEVGKDGMLVRRTYSTINDPYLKQLELSPLGEMREVHPEKYGLWSKGGPTAPGSVVEHVLEYDKLTSYASTSSIYPEGTERMAGKTVYVDIAKAKRAGAKLVTTDEIVQAIDEYAAKARTKDRRWAEHIKQKVLAMDKEVLVQPRPMVPGEGVFSQRGLAISLGIVKYARVVRVVGLAFTGYDLSVASNESIRLKSIRPLEKEVIRQAGGWAGSWAGAVAGARVGATAGAMVGIELGPGAVITGAIGGIVFGAIGYFGGSMIADQIPDK